MRKICITILLFFTVMICSAQQKKIDSLKLALSQTTVDTAKLNILTALAAKYFVSRPDSCILMSQQAYELAVKYKRPEDQARCLNDMALAYSSIGDYAKSMQFYFKSIRAFEAANDVSGVVQEYNNIGSTYDDKEDYKTALRYLHIANDKWNTYMLSHKLVSQFDKSLKDYIVGNIGECYLYTSEIDSADYYLKTAYKHALQINDYAIIDNALRDLGEVELARHNKAAALKYLHAAVASTYVIEDDKMRSISYLSIAKLYHKYLQQDSAEYYAQKALETAVARNYLQDVLKAGKALSAYYDEDHNLAQAYKYLKITIAAKDSLYSQDKVKQLLSIDFDERMRQRDIAMAQVSYQDKIRIYILVGGLVILLIIGAILWRSNRHKQHANEVIRKAMEKLKNAQTQLIQSEKMASLGELTAGIAHEIQNPLNFVNNFSDVNREMIDELETELKAGNVDEALQIAADLKQNEEKINHHGKRADFIVKGMLQHSRTSTGERQLTNVNTLANEFLKLSYQGLRTKDKLFNAEVITDFDEDLPRVNIVQQDMGRVLLNLFNNAFYAVREKQKTAGTDYLPEVTVSTFTSPSGWVEIKVKDNGNGIPGAIKDKIMQPFFTTKPAGEGTGLGLSLSYDIVVKGHGGKIDIETKEGEYTVFTVLLPM